MQRNLRYSEKGDDDDCQKQKSQKHLKILFIAWAPYSNRAYGICHCLKAKPCFITYKFRKKAYSPIKYFLLLIKTILVLKKEQPELIICQNPPVFCGLCCLAYRQLFLRTNKRMRLVVDAHTGSFDSIWRSIWLRRLSKLLLNNASAVILTNSKLAEIVSREYQVNQIFVIEDKILESDGVGAKKFDISTVIDLSQGKLCDNNNNKERLSVVIPSSFASDEPIEEIFQAAGSTPSVSFYMTGDATKLDKQLLKKKPSNVIITGFLSYDNYLTLMHDADAVMVLTKRDNTMLCGAYEAVSLNKPLITSNWEPLRRYFNRGAIYVDNTKEEIERAVNTIQKNVEILIQEGMHTFKLKRMEEWEKKFQHFEDWINNDDDNTFPIKREISNSSITWKVQNS
jgi:glycosyltransferase involved in cell wall biosynthesis